MENEMISIVLVERILKRNKNDNEYIYCYWWGGEGWVVGVRVVCGNWGC